jgi:hypothetical protein
MDSNREGGKGQRGEKMRGWGIAIFFRVSESFRRYKYYDGDWFQFPTSETGFGFRQEFVDVNLYM